MRVAFGEWSVEWLREIEASSMRQKIEACDGGHILLGEDDDHSEYFSLIVRNVQSKHPCLGVGVCSEGHGLTPQFLFRQDIAEILVGYNSAVASILVRDGALRFQLRLDCLFYEFVDTKNERDLLVIHELGVVALEDDGRVRWKYTKDVVERFEVSDTEIHLDFMDRPSVTLSIADGHLIE